MQKINKRLNIIDRTYISKEEGIRLVDCDNHIVIDLAQNLPGKGVYLKYDESKLKCLDDRVLSRAFRRKVSKAEAEQLRKELETIWTTKQKN